MVKICVASVFASDNDVNQKWLDLQLRFLQKTTANYDHYAVVVEKSSEENEAVFRSKTNVIIPDRSSYRDRPKLPPYLGCHKHLRGLNKVQALFKENIGKYDGFLLLDSDAFPVQTGWLETLHTAMSGSNTGKDIAVAQRFEHMENRLHCSILYCLPHAVNNLHFHHAEIDGGCMLATRELDMVIGDYQVALRNKVFPLVNSNQHKVHPLMCLVYYHMFYHHGAASREAMYRSNIMYWNFVLRGYVKNVNIKIQQKQLTDRLFDDPERFIEYLSGWNA